MFLVQLFRSPGPSLYSSHCFNDQVQKGFAQLRTGATWQRLTLALNRKPLPSFRWGTYGNSPPYTPTLIKVWPRNIGGLHLVSYPLINEAGQLMISAPCSLVLGKIQETYFKILLRRSYGQENSNHRLWAK